VQGPFNVESLVVERGDEHRWLRVEAAFVDLGLGLIKEYFPQATEVAFVVIAQRFSAAAACGEVIHLQTLSS